MRDAILIFIAIILAMVIGGYLFFNGAPTLNLPQGRNFPAGVSFTVLQEGQYAQSIDWRTNYRIMNDKELVELWGIVYDTAAPTIPTVDFSHDEVVAVFDGSHSSGGYRIQVVRISDEGGKRTVYLRRETPGPDCAVTDAITNPFQIIRVSKTALPVTREEETVISECR